jgi:hypothetical protein
MSLIRTSPVIEGFAVTFACPPGRDDPDIPVTPCKNDAEDGSGEITKSDQSLFAVIPPTVRLGQYRTSEYLCGLKEGHAMLRLIGRTFRFIPLKTHLHNHKCNYNSILN